MLPHLPEGDLLLALVSLPGDGELDILPDGVGELAAGGGHHTHLAIGGDGQEHEYSRRQVHEHSRRQEQEYSKRQEHKYSRARKLTKEAPGAASRELPGWRLSWNWSAGRDIATVDISGRDISTVDISASDISTVDISARDSY